MNVIMKKLILLSLLLSNKILFSSEEIPSDNKLLLWTAATGFTGCFTVYQF